MSQADTIVALATPAGESAIGVVRLSGAACEFLPEAVFKRPSPTPRFAHLATYRNLCGEALDETLFIYYEKDCSYTGQPALEIFCHGNPLILRKVVDDLVARGCRLAEPGEFTRLAFMSGKMELIQAEAVATLIRARSDRAIEIANSHLRGETGQRVNRLRNQALEVLAQLEVYVDFPHEDLPPEELAGPIHQLETLLNEIARAAETGKFAHVLESGIRIIVTGEPNAGKSSLFNALCGKTRVIVSDEPGTTRDYVGERFHLGAFEIELIDTAGIRNEATGIELTGMERTLGLAEQTDFFLLTLDSAASTPTLPHDFLARLGPQNCIVVENKIDLTKTPKHHAFLSEILHAQTSALTGKGLDELKTLLEEVLEKNFPSPSSDELIVNARHAECLLEAEASLRNTIGLLREDPAVEFALSELRRALDSIGQIVGGVDNEDMLDRLFQSFCIGK